MVDLFRVFGSQRHSWKSEVGSVIRFISSYVIVNVSGTEPNVRLLHPVNILGIVGTGHSTLTKITEGPVSTVVTSEVDFSPCLKHSGKD